MFFSIYKPRQGKYTRLGTALIAALIIGLGCLRLYRLLEAADVGQWVESMVPASLFVVLGILAFYLVNKPSAADFLIAGEGEMKKVNWSSRKEIAVSTFIVLMVVVVMSVVIGIIDTVFRLFFDWLLT